MRLPLASRSQSENVSWDAMERAFRRVTLDVSDYIINADQMSGLSVGGGSGAAAPDVERRGALRADSGSCERRRNCSSFP